MATRLTRDRHRLAISEDAVSAHFQALLNLVDGDGALASLAGLFALPCPRLRGTWAHHVTTRGPRR